MLVVAVLITHLEIDHSEAFESVRNISRLFDTKKGKLLAILPTSGFF
jgi:hypothetical protein